MNKKLLPLLGMILLIAGCATVEQYFGKPEAAVKAVNLQSLDLNAMTFNCDYDLSNPYPVGIKVHEVSADIICNGTAVTTLSTDSGLDISASSTSSNSVLFALPYDSVFTIVENAADTDFIPFKVAGNVVFDLSSVPYADGKTLTVPFEADFDVPVFKPEFRVTDGRLVLPSAVDVAKALVTGGMNIFKAGIAAGNLILGQPVDGIVFEDLDLDVGIEFTLSVDNKGGAPWQITLNKCGIESGVSSVIELNVKDDNRIIDSSGEAVGLSAIVNTLDFGNFIAGMFGGQVLDSMLVLDSTIVFPGYLDDQALPVMVRKELAMDSFKFGTK